ncbi:hypothetical protein G7046_g2118 [Stylonectria norvegica]|nr:hypothetical protein G7046_g2118 [Stylonectria norvegica]
MPAIPIYRSSPINPSKASGITPQTAQPEPTKTTGLPLSVAARTTDAPSREYSSYMYPAAYPAAQPDRRPSLPAPTGASNREQWLHAAPQPDRRPSLPQWSYQPAEPGRRPSLPAPTGAPRPLASYQPKPTPTWAAEHVSPPPPQPGAVPTPPQMSYAAPSGSQYVPAGSSTTTAQRMAGPGPTLLYGTSAGADQSHPPGYYQNVNASEFSSSQREAHNVVVGENNRRLSLMGDYDDDEGVWDTAKKWAAAAGGSIAAAEQEVWKKINGE